MLITSDHASVEQRERKAELQEREEQLAEYQYSDNEYVDNSREESEEEEKGEVAKEPEEQANASRELNDEGKENEGSLILVVY